MYREHLLSIDHVQKLLYHQVDNGVGGQRSLRAPPMAIINWSGRFPFFIHLLKSVCQIGDRLLYKGATSRMEGGRGVFVFPNFLSFFW